MSTILGISDYYHDSGAVIIKDGKILAAVNEERFSRVKHDGRLPVSSLMYVLHETNLSPRDIDVVAVCGLSYRRSIFNEIRSFFNTGIYSRKALRRPYIILVGKKRWNEGVRNLLANFGFHNPHIELVEHHHAHACSAYFTSGFDKATVITLDFGGDGLSGSINLGENGHLTRLKGLRFPHSPAICYAVITDYLGFLPDCDEGKIMSLGCYGDCGPAYREFTQLIKYKDSYPFFAVDTKALQGTLLDPFTPRLGREYLGQFLPFLAQYKDEDIAAALQKRVEDTIRQFILKAVEMTGIDKIALAGGLFLNVKLNKILMETEEITDIYIQPNAGDGGVPLGAALAIQADLKEDGERISFEKMDHAYFGTHYSNEYTEKILKKAEGITYEYTDDPAGEAAELLNQNQIIGWFMNRMEWGPRALGARSVLANPAVAENKDRLNLVLKQREWFQPFAPSMLLKPMGEYVESARESPFMLLAFDVREEKKKEIPAVVHVDGTTRPQTVTGEHNREYEKMIRDFENLSGIPLVLNTSFNKHGLPIVCSPRHAVEHLQWGCIDGLVLGNYVAKRA